MLEHRTELERQAVGSDDADPAGAEQHPATDAGPDHGDVACWVLKTTRRRGSRRLGAGTG